MLKTIIYLMTSPLRRSGGLGGGASLLIRVMKMTSASSALDFSVVAKGRATATKGKRIKRKARCTQALFIQGKAGWGVVWLGDDAGGAKM